MNDHVGPIADENELAAALADAFREAVKYRERSDGGIVQVAERARGMAVELSDRAFAAALRSVLDGVRNDREAGCEVMVLAEQFAHSAGAKCFSRKTHSLIAEMRRHELDSQQLGGGSETPGLAAAFRAYVLALARAVGMSITVQDLKGETSLREQEPLLWLDLATECLASDVYVDNVRSLLEADAFSPFELVRRLPMIVRHQGVSIAQEVLEAACRDLYKKGRYDDAWSLINRAEEFESRGWRRPMSGPVVDVSGLRTERDYVEVLLFDPLEFSSADPVRIVERFRSHMTSCFALIDDDRGEGERGEDELRAREAEEERRMHLRKEIFRRLPDCRGFERILITMVLQEYRYVDAFGHDWWQDSSVQFMDRNTVEEKFSKVVRSAGEAIELSRSNQMVLTPVRQTKSDRIEDALRSNAAAAGF